MSPPRALLSLMLLWALPTGLSARPPGRIEPLERAVGKVEGPGESIDVLRGALARRIPRASEAAFVVRAEQRSAGLTHLRIEEEIAGLPVHQGRHVLVLDAADMPFALISGEVADGGSMPGFQLDARQALAIASRAVDGEALELSAPLKVSTEGVPDGWSRADLPGRPPAYLRQVVHPRGPRPAWRIEIAEAADPAEIHAILVDGADGSILERGSLTNHAAAQARVYPRGFRHGAELRPFIDGDVVLDIASPQGWMDVNQSLGNNAQVWEDRIGDTTTTPGLVATGVGDPLSFDFPFTGVPLDDIEAALTNVFWAFNDAHDRFWRLGFDEASGSVQFRNHGRGGFGNDPARAWVQYRAGVDATVVRNTSTASTNADGTSTAFTFGLWDRSGELRDGAFETGLLFHEYAHVVIIRMLGGDGTCDDGNQPAGLAEGWADYFAASFTGDPVIGPWVGPNPDIGIRTAAIDRSTWTYSNLCSTNPGSLSCIATENGEIWAGALWDLRREMIRAHGQAGIGMTDRLVVEGMRYTPCRPSYVEARDGILMADLALSGGANRCVIWDAMAMRGLGHDAVTTGPDDRYPIAGYASGPECRAASEVAWDRPRYGDDAEALVRLTDARSAGAARTLRVTSSGGDAEDFVASAPTRGPGLVRIVPVPLRPGAARPGDGIVQVANGGTISVTCTDCSGAPRADAAISRALSVTVVTHQLSGESCHDDDSEALVSDFNNDLPSLLDAGEIAVVAVTLGNAEDFPLEDVRITVSCDNPNVQVLPRGEMTIGAVDGRSVNPAGFTVNLRALAAASPAVAFGDTAALTFRVTARGFEGSTRLVMELAGDYQADRGVRSWGGTETFEASSPSAAAWTHAPAYGEPGDLWGLQDCGNGGGRAMVYASPGCTDYADTEASAMLQSPPLFDFSGGVKAIRPLAATWWNDVDLGYALRAPNYCDSEMVIAYLTDNPNRPNFVDPRADRGASLQYWIQVPGLNNTRNTAGWAQAFPQGNITTASISGMNPANVRLMWGFFTDVYNPRNDGGCRITDPDGVGGGYKLDDVTFTYDLARVIPAVNTTCARTCGVRTVTTLSPPGGARCAGQPITISAAGSEAAGCAGTLEYRFTGPGTDSGWIASDSFVTSAMDGASWTANVRCSTDTGCSQSVAVADPTLDDVDVGRIRPDSMTVSRAGADVVLRWDGTRSPVSYAVFRADSARADGAARLAGLAELALPVPGDALRTGTARELSWREVADTGGEKLSIYRVLSSLPCAGTALDR